jgi:hypothetical protein
MRAKRLRKETKYELGATLRLKPRNGPTLSAQISVSMRLAARLAEQRVPTPLWPVILRIDEINVSI